MTKPDPDTSARIQSAQSFAKAIENLLRQGDGDDRNAVMQKEERFIFGDKTPRVMDQDDDEDLASIEL